MKRALAILLCTCLAITGCVTSGGTETASPEPTASGAAMPAFSSLDDPELLSYLEGEIYSELIDDIDNDQYLIENVELAYVSKEYIDELLFNSQENIYFGYTLSQIAEAFGDTSYVFTVDNEGNTVVAPFEPYDTTWNEVLENVAIGSGVILVCVTVSAVTAGVGLPAVSAIFAVSAKTGAAMALQGGAIGGAIAGVVAGAQTKDLDEALMAAALGASDGFKWGAIMGAPAGGVGEAMALRGAASNGLTAAEAATIQQESKYPVDVIKGFQTTEQYEICKEAGLTVKNVNNKAALVREIDLEYTKDGMTNLERMFNGRAPLDATGQAYELHHIGQKVDSTLAILTRAEHRQGGNHAIWHYVGEATENPASASGWSKQASDFWIDFAENVAR